MPPKRKRSGNEETSNPENDARKRYAYLKPTVRRIPEKTIKTKWTTLPEPVQDKVRDLFHSLERPVIVRQQNERKRIEAQSAVRAVVNNLGRRLPRMPFPPITKDSNFDYESALDEHRTLEANLATINDSADLLSAEIAKEEALLAEEKQSLQEMERNAKRAETERKRQMKNEHPVLRRLDDLPQAHRQGGAEFTLVNTKKSQITLDELDDDPEIRGLMKQLHGHLQSMQSNTATLAGLGEAITRSQAALDLYTTPND
ncbi:CENP-A-nucleosome distal centromere subunit CENP-Q [Penicillium daleae]|uniref:CENP-A-nucleosome distal centromere subunit CENP-Q n=1 Tax=Penicillium daleae TaxID=63821 RepID=A0AAD6C312_9EURO|nr:CENP-A-nucleosome distal centromere subunit CENP-Q [Penicillium daleae]KAJ5444738.1 CENP-A-nucleosome distal centromere subunit CENP-Q [Penicillium daleae]